MAATESVLAISAGVGVTTAIVASVMPDAETIDSVSQLPVTVVLGLVLAACLFLMYKLSIYSIESMKKESQANREAQAEQNSIVRGFVVELRNRPCLHAHRRDSEDLPHPHARKDDPQV